MKKLHMPNNLNKYSTLESYKYWWTVLSLLLITGAVNLQVPLYHQYAEINHASHAVSSLAFAAYVAGLVPVLFGFAGASDRMGRKLIIITALSCSLLATLLMIFFSSMNSLFFARVLQGVGVGLAMGTVTAFLSEQRPGTEKLISAHVALASSLGFGGGALATTISLMYSQEGIPISFWIALIAFPIVMMGMWKIPTSNKRRNVPLTRIPKFISGNISPYFAICAAWSVSGLVIALLPAQLAIHDLATWTGPSLFLINIAGIMFQPMARRLTPKINMAIGCVLVPIGYLTLIYGAQQGSILYLLLGSSIAGAACYGFTYLGGLTYVVEKSELDKARSVSGYFLAAYVGFSVPSILLGMVADSKGVSNALESFGLLIVLVHIVIFIMTMAARDVIKIHIASEGQGK